MSKKLTMGKVIPLWRVAEDPAQLKYIVDDLVREYGVGMASAKATSITAPTIEVAIFVRSQFEEVLDDDRDTTD